MSFYNICEIIAGVKTSIESIKIRKKTESARLRLSLRVCYYQCDISIYAKLCRIGACERSLEPECFFVLFF